jgi:gliding motility-associatede transport system auxiliary component
MNKQQKRTQQLVNGALLIIVVVLLGWLSTRFKFQADWTANHRNTLTEASEKFLKTIPDPVKFIAFTDTTAENGQDSRDYIRTLVGRYQKLKPNISLEFVDPARDPGKVKQYNIDARGEVVLEYQGRRETLRAISESAITGAMERLTDAGEHYVVFLQGHGERSIGSEQRAGTENDYDQFAQALREKGLKVAPLNLVKSPSIPDNTSVLVIASPTQKLLDGEVRIIDDYLKAGGNLLWLNDPEQPPGLEAVAKDLAVSWENGFAVFPDYQTLGTGSPAIYLATDYPENPVTADFDEVTVFPLVRPLAWDKDAAKAAGWNVQPLLVTSQRSWLETGSMKGEISFDPKTGDKPGPLTIGLTLSRPAPEAPAADKDAKAEAKPTDKPRSQRVAVVGDSDFLANVNLAALGNKQLGLNLLQWLASRDAQISVDVPKAPDTELFMNGIESWLVLLVFAIALPLLLLGYGITRWLSRRRK